MLLRFRVGNHLSIRDEQELSLVASTLTDDESGLIESPAVEGLALVPAAVIYGANASGKSNVVDAFRCMKVMILESHSKGDPAGGTGRTAFALDPDFLDRPTVFEADFILDGGRYVYGFDVTDEAFICEWLYGFPMNKRQKLFERHGQEFEFGRSLKGRNAVISELTRPNSLFLSAAAQNGHPFLLGIRQFFRSVSGSSVVEVQEQLIDPCLGEEGTERRVIEFMKTIGAGVVNCRRITLRPAVGLVDKPKGPVGSQSAECGQSRTRPLTTVPELQGVELAHEGAGGREVYFRFQHESAGTKRLLLLMLQVFAALDRGSPIFVDELDASLHSQACEAVLSLFMSRETNPNGAQLVATTHDTNLLRSPYLRRDQIWFTEKDPEGATCLYPLTDIRTRKGDDIEKGYLQGRYGAIPFAGSLPHFSSPV